MATTIKDVGEQFQEQGKKVLDTIGNLIKKSPETQLVEIMSSKIRRMYFWYISNHLIKNIFFL